MDSDAKSFIQLVSGPRSCMVAPGSRALPDITASNPSCIGPSPAAPASNALRNPAQLCRGMYPRPQSSGGAGRCRLPHARRRRSYSSYSNQRRPACSLQGFRKVDPDQWEFVHMLFLSEQMCLLARILRRSHGGKCKDDGNTGNAAAEDTVAMEVVQLRQEQQAIRSRWSRCGEACRRTGCSCFLLSFQTCNFCILCKAIIKLTSVLLAFVTNLLLF
jgi:hypothetical protein